MPRAVVSDSVFDLFDFRFKKYLTPWIIRFNWLLVVSWAVICALMILVALIGTWLPDMSTDTPSGIPKPGDVVTTIAFEAPSIPDWFSRRLASCIGLTTALFGITFVVLWARVALELAIVIFNIALTLETISDKANSLTADKHS